VRTETSEVLYEDELDATAPGLTSLVGIWANPVINLAAVAILALTSGWMTALVALCAWLMSMLFWLILSRL
jgi:ABC-type bacteriocin/lantibiotic exporter with double-glycine peptidase domain